MEVVADKKEKGASYNGLGRAPSGWKINNLGSLFVFKNGLNKAKEFFGHGTPIINYMDVYSKNGLYKNDIRGQVDVDVNEAKAFEAKQGDVFFTRTSETVDEVGLASVLLEDIPHCVYSGFVLRGRPISDELESTFKQYCFRSSYLRKQIQLSSSYTTRALTNGKVLSKVLVKYPTSKTEQIAIATALTDTDSLIQSLEALIEKKKNIKTATMQQLLTGKTRLPGFSGEWVNIPIGDAFDFYHGRGLPKSALRDGGHYKCIHYGQLFTEYGEQVDTVNSRTDMSDGIFLSKKNDVLMPTSDVTPRGLATASCIKEDGVVLGGGILVMRPKTEVDGSFVSYFVSNNKNSVLKLVKGSTVFHLYANDISKLELSLPPTIEEQEQIVEVLENMKSEITGLQKRRDKLIAIKQGMMHELLTGNTRLV